MSQALDTPGQIASAISQGDRKAEAVLLDRYYRTLLYILRKRVRDEEHARDLCQETFRITIERLRREPLAEPEKLAAFLQSIAANLSIAEGRKRERRQTYADSDYVELVADTGADQSVVLDRERIASAVRHLLTELDNLRDQRILYRYYIDELDKEEICAELELTHRHFDKVISRARTRFRELVDASGRDNLLEPVQGRDGHA